ncbi:MAG TPA: hypothetical protein VES79_06645 [Solirubrobacteraceae bacterium]|nr:hypothetical protein [Solirubrobacteraceae bacterium]
MWRRLRRRSLAPRRSLLFEHQYAPALVTAIVLAGSAALVLWVLLR